MHFNQSPITIVGVPDQAFYSSIPGFSQKSTIAGNLRSDLLSQAGNKFYNDYSTSLKSLFGDFVLCSDNFAVEHRQGDKYFIPKFNISISIIKILVSSTNLLF